MDELEPLTPENSIKLVYLEAPFDLHNGIIWEKDGKFYSSVAVEVLKGQGGWFREYEIKQVTKD